MALQGSGQISASQIANEFGYNHPISGTQSGNEVSLGTYRKVGFSQSNYPQSIGALNFSSIDGGGSVQGFRLFGPAWKKSYHYAGCGIYGYFRVRAFPSRFNWKFLVECSRYQRGTLFCRHDVWPAGSFFY